MNHCTRAIRIATLAAALALAAEAAEAGPPLVCQPFDPGEATLLPWGDSTAGWRAPDPQYDRRRLVDDTERLLSSGQPVLARMENLRRAAIYATEDTNLASALVSALIARTRTETGGQRKDADALFDAGYFLETFEQAAQVFKMRPPTSVTRIGPGAGDAMVRSAIGFSNSIPAMEYAASLITTGATSAAHRRRALDGAAADAVLARHLGR